MNNEKLKIKIAAILQSRPFENGCCKDVEIGYITALNIADALIAAGIGDVKSLEISDASKEQSSINYYCEMRSRRKGNEMKFYIYTTTSKSLNKYDLSIFNISKNSTDDSFVEINTIEKILAISKITGKELVISIAENAYSDLYKFLKENGCAGYIEIYDNYRE